MKVHKVSPPAPQDIINTPPDTQTPPPTTALSIRGRHYTAAPSLSGSTAQEQFALALLESQSSAASTPLPDNHDDEPEEPNNKVSLLKKIMVASATLAWGMEGLVKEGHWPTVSQVDASQKPPTAEDVSRVWERAKAEPATTQTATDQALADSWFQTAEELPKTGPSVGKIFNDNTTPEPELAAPSRPYDPQAADTGIHDLGVDAQIREPPKSVIQSTHAPPGYGEWFFDNLRSASSSAASSIGAVVDELPKPWSRREVKVDTRPSVRPRVRRAATEQLFDPKKKTDDLRKLGRLQQGIGSLLDFEKRQMFAHVNSKVRSNGIHEVMNFVYSGGETMGGDDYAKIFDKCGVMGLLNPVTQFSDAVTVLVDDMVDVLLSKEMSEKADYEFRVQYLNQMKKRFEGKEFGGQLLTVIQEGIRGGPIGLHEMVKMQDDIDAGNEASSFTAKQIIRMKLERDIWALGSNLFPTGIAANAVADIAVAASEGSKETCRYMRDAFLAGLGAYMAHEGFHTDLEEVTGRTTDWTPEAKKRAVLQEHHHHLRHMLYKEGIETITDQARETIGAEGGVTTLPVEVVDGRSTVTIDSGEHPGTYDLDPLGEGLFALRQGVDIYPALFEEVSTGLLRKADHNGGKFYTYKEKSFLESVEVSKRPKAQADIEKIKALSRGLVFGSEHHVSHHPLEFHKRLGKEGLTMGSGITVEATLTGPHGPFDYHHSVPTVMIGGVECVVDIGLGKHHISTAHPVVIIPKGTWKKLLGENLGVKLSDLRSVDEVMDLSRLRKIIEENGQYKAIVRDVAAERIEDFNSSVYKEIKRKITSRQDRHGNLEGLTTSLTDILHIASEVSQKDLSMPVKAKVLQEKLASQTYTVRNKSGGPSRQAKTYRVENNLVVASYKKQLPDGRYIEYQSAAAELRLPPHQYLVDPAVRDYNPLASNSVNICLEDEWKAELASRWDVPSEFVTISRRPQVLPSEKAYTIPRDIAGMVDFNGQRLPLVELEGNGGVYQLLYRDGTAHPEHFIVTVDGDIEPFSSESSQPVTPGTVTTIRAKVRETINLRLNQDSMTPYEINRLAHILESSKTLSQLETNIVMADLLADYSNKPDVIKEQIKNLKRKIFDTDFTDASLSNICPDISYEINKLIDNGNIPTDFSVKMKNAFYREFYFLSPKVKEIVTNMISVRLASADKILADSVKQELSSYCSRLETIQDKDISLQLKTLSEQSIKQYKTLYESGSIKRAVDIFDPPIAASQQSIVQPVEMPTIDALLLDNISILKSLNGKILKESIYSLIKEYKKASMPVQERVLSELYELELKRESVDFNIYETHDVIEQEIKNLYQADLTAAEDIMLDMEKQSLDDDEGTLLITTYEAQLDALLASKKTTTNTIKALLKYDMLEKLKTKTIDIGLKNTLAGRIHKALKPKLYRNNAHKNILPLGSEQAAEMVSSFDNPYNYERLQFNLDDLSDTLSDMQQIKPYDAESSYWKLKKEITKITDGDIAEVLEQILDKEVPTVNYKISSYLQELSDTEWYLYEDSVMANLELEMQRLSKKLTDIEKDVVLDQIKKESTAISDRVLRNKVLAMAEEKLINAYSALGLEAQASQFLEANIDFPRIEMDLKLIFHDLSFNYPERFGVLKESLLNKYPGRPELSALLDRYTEKGPEPTEITTFTTEKGAIPFLRDGDSNIYTPCDHDGNPFDEGVRYQYDEGKETLELQERAPTRCKRGLGACGTTQVSFSDLEMIFMDKVFQSRLSSTDIIQLTRMMDQLSASFGRGTLQEQLTLLMKKFQGLPEKAAKLELQELVRTWEVSHNLPDSVPILDTLTPHLNGQINSLLRTPEVGRIRGELFLAGMREFHRLPGPLKARAVAEIMAKLQREISNSANPASRAEAEVRTQQIENFLADYMPRIKLQRSTTGNPEVAGTLFPDEYAKIIENVQSKIQTTKRIEPKHRTRQPSIPLKERYHMKMTGDKPSYQRLSDGERLPLNDGVYYFVITRDAGAPELTLVNNETPGGHYSLGGGRPVLYGGEILILDNEIVIWTDGSGHYRPSLADKAKIPVYMRKLLSEDKFRSCQDNGKTVIPKEILDYQEEFQNYVQM